MIKSIISIILSIIAAFIYDAVKKAYINRKAFPQSEIIKYSPQYILSVKREFYIGFFLGIAFISIPDMQYSFFNVMLDVFAYFSFFIALMGFMCLVDVVNYMSNKTTNDNTNNMTDQ